MRTDYTESKDGTVNCSEWENILGRLDAVVDEINRALGRSTRMEEARSASGITRQQYLDSRKCRDDSST